MPHMTNQYNSLAEDFLRICPKCLILTFKKVLVEKPNPSSILQ